MKSWKKTAPQSRAQFAHLATTTWPPVKLSSTA